MELALAPVAERVERLRVRFATPTELKSGQQIADPGVRCSRGIADRDRLSTLRELYGGGALESISAQFGDRAAGVRSDALRDPAVDVTRRAAGPGRSFDRRLCGRGRLRRRPDGVCAVSCGARSGPAWGGRRFGGRVKSPWGPNAPERQSFVDAGLAIAARRTGRSSVGSLSREDLQNTVGALHRNITKLKD